MVIRYNRQIGVQRNFVFALSTRNSAYENGNKVGAMIEEQVQISFKTIRIHDTVDLFVKDEREEL